MNLLSVLLVWVLSFALGMIFGFISKNRLDTLKQPIVLNEKPLVYEISEKENIEYRNFLNYDGTEQN